MAKMMRALAISGLVVAATWGSGAVHAQRTAGLNTTQIIQISAATKTLDLGASNGAQTPPNWTDAGFDDSSWTPATPAAPTCASNHANEVPSIGSPTALYWGTIPSDAYLFRQDFTLPTAKSYYGSTLSVGSIVNDQYNLGYTVYLNGHDVTGGTRSDRSAVRTVPTWWAERAGNPSEYRV